MKSFIRNSGTALALVGMLTVSLPLQAAVLDTETVIGGAAQAAASVQQRQDVTGFLARADVRQQLSRLGVNPDQAAARVAALSNEEVAGLHARLPQAQAGGDILGAVLFVFLVLLVTDLLGLTKVFPFTRSR
ncbi:MAG TPA: PA2779 family protein [Fluviicoccus sp.]|nr:PA2779 family protein [Fluviicoccus sp.]